METDSTIADRKDLLEKLLRRMNVSFEAIEYFPGESEAARPRFVIKTSDSALLIGSRGEHLLALNYIVRRIIGRQAGDGALPPFVVDVNDYQEKAFEQLRTKARIMCERARSYKVDVPLEPMSSYERMLIHTYLEHEPHIKTESAGEGKNRRVVIKYVAEAE